MNRWTEKFDRWWFAPVAPTRLAVIRILTGLIAVWWICRRGLWMEAFRDKPKDLFRPTGLTTLLDGPLSSEWITALGVVTTVAGVLFTLGLFWRVAGPLFGFLLLFTLTYRNSWGMLFHNENMMVLHVLVLGLMPSARSFAIDPWIRRKFKAPVLDLIGISPGETAPHWKFGSAIRMLQLVTTLPYLVAGFAKVRGPAGWAWALGDNLRDQVGMNGIWYAMTTGRAAPFTYHIYDMDWPWLVMSVITLVVEFGAPIALINRWYGYSFSILVLGLHWGILGVMGIGFKYQLSGIAFACFLEWEQIPIWFASVRNRFRRPQEE